MWHLKTINERKIICVLSVILLMNIQSDFSRQFFSRKIKCRGLVNLFNNSGWLGNFCVTKTQAVLFATTCFATASYCQLSLKQRNYVILDLIFTKIYHSDKKREWWTKKWRRRRNFEKREEGKASPTKVTDKEERPKKSARFLNLV